MEASIDPARYAGFNYVTEPTASSYELDRNLGSSTTFEATAGWLQGSGEWVWGVEAQVGTTDLQDTVVIGPINANATSSGSAPPGFILSSVDTLTADFDAGVRASVRLRAGRAFGDRVLVSAFAGPTGLETKIKLMQESVVRAGYIVFVQAPPLVRPVSIEEETAASRAAGESRSLWGGVIGGTVEVKLSEQWALHAEGSLSRYQSIEATAPAYARAGSQVSYRPEIQSLSLGLTYRF